MQYFRYSLAFLVFAAVFLLPSSAGAFFSGSDLSDGGAGASSLQINLTTASSSSTEKNFMLGNTGELPLDYGISATASSTAGSFCEDLEVTASRNGAQFYDGPVDELAASSTPLASGFNDDISYEFRDDGPAGPRSGECMVEVRYEAAQKDQSFGTAFFDTEESRLTFTPADFSGDELPEEAGPDTPIISEVMFDPGEDADGSTADEDREWVEVRNASTSAVDLTDWELAEDGTDHGISSYNGSQTVSPGGFAILADDAATFAAEYPDVDVPIFDSAFSLRNDTNTLTLKNPAGDAIDQKSYDSSDGQFDNGNTVQYVNGASCVEQATAGKVNSCQTGSQSSSATTPESGLDSLKPRGENEPASSPEGDPSGDEAGAADTSTASTTARSTNNQAAHQESASSTTASSTAETPVNEESANGSASSTPEAAPASEPSTPKKEEQVHKPDSKEGKEKEGAEEPPRQNEVSEDSNETQI